MKHVFIILAALLGVNANAITLDFEEFNPPAEWGHFQQLGPVLLHRGYVLTTPKPDPFAFSSVDRSWRFNGRSTAMTVNDCSGLTTLTEGANNPFRLSSIDLAEINGAGAPAVVTFVAKLANGRGALHRIITDGRQGWQRFTFPAKFTGLLSVSWRQSDCSAGNGVHMLDNVRVLP